MTSTHQKRKVNGFRSVFSVNCVQERFGDFSCYQFYTAAWDNNQTIKFGGTEKELIPFGNMKRLMGFD
jgi:hypothetical protein